jgi:hypothetical protein
VMPHSPPHSNATPDTHLHHGGPPKDRPTNDYQSSPNRVRRSGLVRTVFMMAQVWGAHFLTRCYPNPGSDINSLYRHQLRPGNRAGCILLDVSSRNNPKYLIRIA